MSQIRFNEIPLQRIHPALEFTAEHAYVGQWLRIPGREDTFYIIRDDGEMIESSTEELARYGIELATRIGDVPQRWSTESIRQYVEGNATPVDKSILFNIIKQKFTQYIDLPDNRLYDFLTLWNIGTYFFPLFNTYPYVYVGGVSQSGKSKLLTLCSCICFNSIPSANMSTACIYRLIQNARCSLFIDETEQLSNRHRAGEFRNILLCGYRRGQNTYRNIRTLDGNYEPRAFEVYSPKMIANIEGLEDVLASRCITIIMQRSLNEEITNREVDINDAVWQDIKDSLYLFLMENWREVKQTYTELENATPLRNRDWELWKPILSLARFFGEEIFEAMKDLAIENTEENRMEHLDTDETVLVEVLLSMVTEDDFYSLRDIRNRIRLHLDDGNWFSERRIGNLLRRLGFSERRRTGSGFQYFLRVSDIEDCARRLDIVEVGEHSEHSERSGVQDTHEDCDSTETMEDM